MSSNFPNEIDDIPSFLDVTSRDGDLLQQYKLYIQQNDMTNARRVFSQIENADRKIISANKMNKIRDALIALEVFYKTDIVNYTNQKELEWKDIIDMFKFKGLYSNSVIYDVNNIVAYADKGDNHLYIKTNINNKAGIIPTDERYWRKITVKGEKGDPPTGSTIFMFDWNSSQNYKIDSIVSHNNKWWIAVKQNSNSEPKENNINWKLIMEAMQSTYPIQKEEPTAQGLGEIWFEVI